MGQEALEGLRVHLTAHRRSQEIDEALARHGAQILHAPAMVPVPAESDDQLPGRTRETIAFRPEILVVTTGIGLRSWLASADAHGQGERLREVLGEARIVARGAKALGAVREAGFEAEWVAPQETAAEILEHLRQEDLGGRRVAVQYHGMGTDELDTAPEDPEPVRRSIREAAGGTADAVLFTAAGGAEHWVAEATEKQLQALRERSAEGTLGLFAVGSVTAAPLERRGLTVQYPGRFRLGAMLRLVRRWAEEDRGRGGTAQDPGHRNRER